MQLRISLVLGAAVLGAACYGPARQETAAAAAPDTAAIHMAVQALGDRFETNALAGNAAAVASDFTEDGRAEFYGFPSAVGRAAVEGLYTTYFGSNKVTASEVTTQAVSATGPDLASARGVTSVTAEAGGKTSTTHWRWAAAYRKGADGQWRVSYIIGFPDSPSPM